MKKIVLISCVKKKLRTRAKAKDLYISSLFSSSFRFAVKQNPCVIYILSAKYGLVECERVISPYDLTLNTMSTKQIKAWAEKTLNQLRKVSDLNRDYYIFLAAEKYRKYLIPHVKLFEVPLKGLRIGEQLSWLKKQLEK